MENRRTIPAKLKTILEEIAEIKTVVRVYLDSFDITQYAMADLPLVAIPEPAEETDNEMTSQKSLMRLATQLVVYFLHWGITPDVTYGTLLKKIRDKLGVNFTLGGVVTETRVDAISAILGTMPLYNFRINLEMKYLLDETST